MQITVLEFGTKEETLAMISDHDLFGMLGPKRFESRKLLDEAAGQSCVRCGKNDGTIVAAHYHGKFAHFFGRGAGQKTDDFLSAHLCGGDGGCHALFDSVPLEQTEWKSEEERELEFLVCCARTLRRLFWQGHIVVA